MESGCFDLDRLLPTGLRRLRAEGHTVSDSLRPWALSHSHSLSHTHEDTHTYGHTWTHTGDLFLTGSEKASRVNT